MTQNANFRVSAAPELGKLSFAVATEMVVMSITRCK